MSALKFSVLNCLKFLTVMTVGGGLFRFNPRVAYTRYNVCSIKKKTSNEQKCRLVILVQSPNILGLALHQWTD